MASMRAQVSLMFDDADLFENFVEPYKQERLLNGLIIRCLSAYYYNEEVRSLVEGTKLEEVTEGVDVQSTQSICDSIRASLLMQDFLQQELQSTVDNGAEDITNILQKTNDLAKDKGVAKTTTSEYGGGILQLEVHNPNPQQVGASNDTNTGNGLSNDQFSLLTQAIMMVASGASPAEVMSVLGMSGQSVTPVQPSVTVENQSFVAPSQVPMSTFNQNAGLNQTISPAVENANQTIISQPVVEQTTVVNTTPQVVQETVKDTPVNTEDKNEPLEDASDALKDLLGSLDF